MSEQNVLDVILKRAFVALAYDNNFTPAAGNQFLDPSAVKTALIDQVSHFDSYSSDVIGQATNYIASANFRAYDLQTTTSGARVLAFADQKTNNVYFAVNGWDTAFLDNPLETIGDTFNVGLSLIGLPSTQSVEVGNTIQDFIKNTEGFTDKTVNLLGHSLGGFNVKWLNVFFPDLIDNAVVFNSVGVGGVAATALNLLTFGSLQNLFGDSDRIQTVTQSNDIALLDGVNFGKTIWIQDPTPGFSISDHTEGVIDGALMSLAKGEYAKLTLEQQEILVNFGKDNGIISYSLANFKKATEDGIKTNLQSREVQNADGTVTVSSVSQYRTSGGKTYLVTDSYKKTASGQKIANSEAVSVSGQDSAGRQLLEMRFEKNSKGEITQITRAYDNVNGDVYHSVQQNGLAGNIIKIPQDSVIPQEYLNQAGNYIGSYLADGDVLDDILYSSYLSTFLQHGGSFIDYLSTNTLAADAFKISAGLYPGIHTPTFIQTYVQNLEAKLVSVASKYIVDEFGEALGIDYDTFAGGVFEASANAITVKFLSEGIDIVFTDLNSDVLGNIADGSFDLDLSSIDFANIIGGYAGNRLAGEFVTPESEVAAIFGSIGSVVAVKTLGSYIGSIVGSSIPGLGTAIGAFIGQIAGTFLGNLFGGQDDPSAGAYVTASRTDAQYHTGGAWSKDGGKAEIAFNMANAAMNGVNKIIEMTGGNFRRGFTSKLEIGYDGDEYFVNSAGSSREFDRSADAIKHAALTLLKGADIVGGNAIAMRAWHNSEAKTLEQFQLDLSIADAFQTYLMNPTAILALMMNDPDSEAAQQWATILKRAAELELHLPHEKDIDGGWGEVLAARGDINPEAIPEIQGNDIVLTDPITGEVTTLKHVIGPGYEIVRTVGTDGNDTIQIIVDGPSITYTTAGPGDDTFVGHDGIDIFIGGNGDDKIFGGAGEDWLNGGDGNDEIIGGPGDDLLIGGDGDDRLIGGPGKDTIYGGKGNDYIEGNEHADYLYGGDGNDEIHGNEGKEDWLYGEDGDDKLYGTGEDQLIGGKGNDIYYANGDDIEINRLDGHDVVYYSDRGNYISFSDQSISAQDVVYVRSGNDLILKVRGEDQSVTLKDAYLHSQGAMQVGFRGQTAPGWANHKWYYSNLPISASDKDGVELRSGLWTSISKSNFIATENSAGGHYQYVYGTEGKDLIKDNWSTVNDNRFYGLGGNDEIYGGLGNDIISGGEGDDYIDGLDHDDTIYGGTGNDILRGGYGNDKLYGGSGNDTIYTTGVENRTDNYVDLVYAGEGDDYVLAEGGSNTIYGGSGNDQLLAYFAASDYKSYKTNIIYGEEGKDTILGNAGDDRLYGGEGDDSINAGAGNDRIAGGVGNDIINAGDGNDYLIGEAGSDTMDGGAGIDSAIFEQRYHLYDVKTLGVTTTVKAKNGDIDTLTNVEKIFFYDGFLVEGVFKSYSENPDLLREVNIFYHRPNVNDIAYGGGGNDWLIGQGGNDVLWGEAGDDLLYGGDGDDTLLGGPGIDTIHGGNGNDYIEGNEDADYLYGGDGDDKIHGNEGLYDQIYGGDGDDVLYGQDDTFYTGQGNDVIHMNSGWVYVDRGEGHDTVASYSGTVYVRFYQENISSRELEYRREKNDLVIEVLGEDQSIRFKDAYLKLQHKIELQFWGQTTAGSVNPSVYRHTLPLSINDPKGVALSIDIWQTPMRGDFKQKDQKHVWSYVQGGDGDNTIEDNDSGRYMSNRFFGDAGDDYIYGGNSSDTIVGGLGNDRLYGSYNGYNASGARAIERIYGGAGNDEISGGDGDDYIWGGSGDDFIWADRQDIFYDNIGSGQDIVYGGTGNDHIEGQKENDTLYGGEDNDYVSGGEGNDSLNGDEGNDSLNGDEGDDRLYGGEGSDLLDGGTGDDWLYGDEGNDTLLGGAGADILTGGAGNDTLNGEAGNDTLTGGLGADKFIIGKESGAVDTITDFEAGIDKIDLSAFSIPHTFFHSFQQTFVRDGFSTQINLGNNQSLVLRDILPEDLSLADFTGTAMKLSATPIAVNDSRTLNEDTTTTINVLGNDRDPEGDALTVVNVGSTAHGLATLNTNGTITYKPAVNYNGTDSFEYTIKDVYGNTDTASVNLTIRAVNDAPVIEKNTGASTLENGSVVLTGAMLQAKDVETAKGALLFRLTALPTHGTLYVNGVALALAAAFTQAQLTDGAITYRPVAEYHGQDSFTFAVSDGNAQSVSQSFNLSVIPEPTIMVPVDPGETTQQGGGSSGAGDDDEAVTDTNGSTGESNAGNQGTGTDGGTTPTDTNGEVPTPQPPTPTPATPLPPPPPPPALPEEEPNVMNGTGAAERMSGTAGIDIINGRGGSDTLLGRGDDDTLKGGGGNDMLKGNGGGDILKGQGGNDTLKGGGGHDMLYGHNGNDILIGGGGNDILNGGRGSDTLKGNAGADTFVFDSKALRGVDTIVDFKKGQGDKIDISDLLTGYDSTDDALTDFVRITQAGRNSELFVNRDGRGEDFIKIAILQNTSGLANEDLLERQGTLITEG